MKTFKELLKEKQDKRVVGLKPTNINVNIMKARLEYGK